VSQYISGEKELKRLSKALTVYMSVGRLSLAELLRKKAYDLRIKLYQGYRAARWRGSSKGAMQSRGVAFSEMRRRARQGEGIILRKLRGSAEGTGPVVDRRGRKLSSYQLKVWRELSGRQSGIGVLAASFLLKRWSRSGGQRVLSDNKTRLDLVSEVYTQESRSGKLMSRVTLNDDSAQIEGFTSGLAAVGDRTGIVLEAIRAVSLDTEVYLSRKLGDDWDDVARAFGLGDHAI
jgi:hypothetical protein